MTTTQKEQLAGNEATLMNSARGQFAGVLDKLQVIVDEGRDALTQMDAQLEDFDAAHPERTRMTTTQQRDAEKRVNSRSK